MKNLKKGFTLIEVALFLAISGAIFAMVMTNTSRTVARRRYNDSVNDVVEEIRNAYSATINVENYRTKTDDASFWCSTTSAYQGGFHVDSATNTSAEKKTDNYPGRTRCAVYGQVLTFGENAESDIHRYTLIGRAIEKDIEPGDNDEVLSGLKEVGANIITMKQNNETMTSCTAAPAGNWTSHSLQWSGRIENKEDRNLYKGAIMIARSPVSATVHTFIYTAHKDASKDNPENDSTFAVQDWLKNTAVAGCNSATFQAASNDFVVKAINEDKWVRNQDLDVCIGSEDLYAVGNKRRAVRIHGDGSNESAVELLAETDALSICKEI